MLLRGFESRLGLEFSGCGMWHFLKLVSRGFLRVLRYPPSPLHRFNGSANKNKAQINLISTLSNLIAELSLRTTWHVTRHVARDKRSMCCTWFAHDCARAYVLETVRGAVRRLYKISTCAFECDYYFLLLLLLTCHSETILTDSKAQTRWNSLSLSVSVRRKFKSVWKCTRCDLGIRLT